MSLRSIFNNFTDSVFPTLNTFQPNNTFMVTDVFSKALGKHTLKFGGEFRYLQVNERNYASPNGNFVFDGSATGNDFADFLLGAPASSGGYTQAALQFLDSRTRYGGAFRTRHAGKSRPTSRSTSACAGKSACRGMTRKEKFRPLIRGNSLRCFHSLPKA